MLSEEIVGPQALPSTQQNRIGEKICAVPRVKAARLQGRKVALMSTVRPNGKANEAVLTATKGEKVAQKLIVNENVPIRRGIRPTKTILQKRKTPKEATIVTKIRLPLPLKAVKMKIKMIFSCPKIKRRRNTFPRRLCPMPCAVPSQTAKNDIDSVTASDFTCPRHIRNCLMRWETFETLPKSKKWKKRPKKGWVLTVVIKPAMKRPLTSSLKRPLPLSLMIRPQQATVKRCRMMALLIRIAIVGLRQRPRHQVPVR